MKNLFRNWRGLQVGIAIAISTLAAQAVVQVKTLGGGPNQTSPARTGATDGDTLLNAKFNAPFAVATDSSGNLYIADRNNGKIRKISRPGSGDSLTSTFVSRLLLPVGVAIDASNTIYVVTQRDGKLRKFNSSGSLIGTISGLVNPTGLALDVSGNIFVTELGGTVQQIGPDGTLTLVTSGLNRPRGVAVLKSGLLAVSESGNHAIDIVDPLTGATTVLAGGNGAGFNDGPADMARFNQPYGVAAAPNGSVVVADRLNHRVRIVDTNGVVSTLYGVPRSQWHRPFAGWADGPGGVDGTAAARDPVGFFFWYEWHSVYHGAGLALDSPSDWRGIGRHEYKHRPARPDDYLPRKHCCKRDEQLQGDCEFPAAACRRVERGECRGGMRATVRFHIPQRRYDGELRSVRREPHHQQVQLQRAGRGNDRTQYHQFWF